MSYGSRAAIELAIDAQAVADAAQMTADDPLLASSSVLQCSAASHASVSAVSICAFGSFGIVMQQASPG